MEERILTVLKAVALGDLYGDDMGDEYCLYCGYQESSHPVHEGDCPVTIARQLLREQGVILYLYQVSYESPDFFGKWYRHAHGHIAFTEAEALEGYRENTEPYLHPKRRNITATIIEEMN